ncbi:MAG: AAA family ATPase [bacterium]|nr:MAG: AAA family ATPase [bacterium]
MKANRNALLPEDLRFTCDVKDLPWESTDQVPTLERPVGQERALKAIDFGLKIASSGYNLFLVGEPGCGKSSMVNAMVEKKAAGEGVPLDWAYVNNFENPRNPLAVSFPAGKGRIFAHQMRDLVEILRKNIPAALQDKEFEGRRGEIIERMARENAALLEQFQQRAMEENYSFEKIENEYVFIPLRDGDKLSQEDFNALPEEVRETYEETIRRLREQLKETTREARRREEETHKRVDAMARDQVRNAVAPLIESIASAHPDNEKLHGFLEAVLEDILRNFSDFLESGDKSILPEIRIMTGEPPLKRYEVNLIVDMSQQKGAPIVREAHPTFSNLIGKMEYSIQFGMATTSFSQIQAGALHMANGGYLILDALEVLKSPFAWEAIKNSQKAGHVQIEDLGEQYRPISTATLKPEPIQLNTKIVLLGTPFIYYLLLAHDEDFTKLFKVKADFGSTMSRTREAVEEYALFVSTHCRDENLLPFDASALAAVVEYGARIAEDKERLTTRFNRVADLIREASFWARERGDSVVTRDHVVGAQEERNYRYSRIEERLGELIEEGTLMVRTEGQVVGQVNGISVYDMGDYRFAKPTRLTAKVFLGKAGMVNVEREVKMSGSIHNKGVMIVSSYLAMRYASDFPLSLTASVTFEQTYEEVEGDSATAAELLALTSAIAEVPVRQDMAITGSMDQHGNIQPIGGVNEKIEGFFNTCRDRGLCGTQGVVIPTANVRNLMLSPDVIDAVRAGTFAIYSVDSMDEAIELMTGREAGVRGEDGRFPEGTFNGAVEDRLREMADQLRGHEEEMAREEEEE